MYSRKLNKCRPFSKLRQNFPQMAVAFWPAALAGFRRAVAAKALTEAQRCCPVMSACAKNQRQRSHKRSERHLDFRSLT
jgi:hypothetical protein